MKNISNNTQDMTHDLESLEVLESHELKVGNAFHLFRFATVSIEEVTKEDTEG